MNVNSALADALAQVDLGAGCVYRCEVRGRKIEVRVSEEAPAPLRPASLVESDIRCDSWVELPHPSGTFSVLAKLGSLPPPDVPEIPALEGTP
jgi:hypothetical protein